MAAATVTLAIDAYPNGIDNTERYIHVRGTAAISASPATYATGGLALNFTTLRTSPDGQLLPVTSTDITSPVDVEFTSEGVSGWTYGWKRSANTFIILAASGGTAGTGAASEEMTNLTAIPAGVSGDTIRFHAIFNRMRG